MPMCDRPSDRVVRWLAGAILVTVIAAWPSAARAQFVQGAVGGVQIDAKGMVRFELARPGQFDNLRLQAIPDGMRRPSELRWVSLKGLDAAIEDLIRSGKPLSEDMLCLAGLQQVRYVLVCPDRHDIVLAGYGEGWKLDKRGNVVGQTTGRPVMLLDDFLTALRTLAGNVRGPMSCSIDPTQDGIRRVNAFSKRQHAMAPEVVQGIEDQLGNQQVTVNGLPETSHFARVMVAADYRMKRISMGIEASPVPGLVGFMELMSGRGAGNMMPRWWLEPDYQSLARDAEGLSWEIRGASVKAMAESDFFDANGVRQATVKADPASQRWAELMTRRYADLAKAEPVFGQLRNCMDLAVVSALLAQEKLLNKAGCRLPQLTGTDGVPTVKLDPPKQVPSKATSAKKGRTWVVAAGGVSVNPWAIVQKSQTDAAVAEVRAKSLAKENASWWWD